MPIKKCANKKFKIGTGPCVFTGKAMAEKAQRAIKAKQGRKAP